MTPLRQIPDFREAIRSKRLVPVIGIYDVFSARLAARHFDALFVSGFGFAASQYGLPDVGFGTWTDLAWFVQRLRAVLPEQFLLVDIDDGFGDPEIAAHVVQCLERVGASAIVLEDQQRPRRCGHFDGKQVMPVDDYLVKLERVLEARNDLFVIARTDSSDPADALRRVEAFAAAGADGVLVDGLTDLSLVGEIARRCRCPIAFNQIAGGKSPPCTLTELKALGVSIVIYSTPALFAAQRVIETAMRSLIEDDGALPQPGDGAIGVKDCTAVLTEPVRRRVDNQPIGFVEVSKQA